MCRWRSYRCAFTYLLLEKIEKMFGISSKHFSKLENTEENNLQKTCYPIRHVLECDKPMEYLELFYIPGKVLGKYAWLFDVIGPDLHQSCCFTKAYGHYVEGTGSVLCPFSPETIAERFENLSLIHRVVVNI